MNNNYPAHSPSPATNTNNPEPSMTKSKTTLMIYTMSTQPAEYTPTQLEKPTTCTATVNNQHYKQNNNYFSS
eukprot:1841889-Karenia_brevis.AAC.1